MSGNISHDNNSWRSFFWLTVALATFVTILLVPLFPETKYRRNTARFASFKASNGEAKVESEVSSEEAVGGHVVGRGRPSWKQFMPVQAVDSNWWKYIVRDLTTPGGYQTFDRLLSGSQADLVTVIVFFNPIVFWAALMLAGPADLLLLFNLTESGLFAAPPYLWNPGQVGYSNFAFFVGGVIGVATAGPFSDWLAKRLTVKNNGIREAEMRLPALIPFVIFFLISHVVGAVGYDRLWPWEAIIVCESDFQVAAYQLLANQMTFIVGGFGFSGLAVTSIPAVSIAYAVDCYRPIAGEIMIGKLNPS